MAQDELQDQEELVRENERLKIENQNLRAHRLGDQVADVFGKLIEFGGYVGIAFFVYLSVDSLSGKKAKAEIAVESSMSFGSTKLTVFIAIVFGFFGVLYGKRQDRLKKKYIEKYHPYQREEEEQIDPTRTSSELTPQGETRPEDQR